MDNSNHPLTDIFKTAPATAIPNVNTQAYKALCLLATNRLIPTKEELLNKQLSCTRSAINSLMTESHGCWNIINVTKKGSTKILARMLDPRHISGDPQQDAAARRERLKNYKSASHKEAKQGRIREFKAFSEMTEAQAEYFKSLGKAANDEQ
jgi:hypothetical protein